MSYTNIINLDQAPLAKSVFYGGNAGAKEAVIYEHAIWMLKYPKSTRDLRNPQVSYTTSPLSEYLGSKVYEVLGLPVHETLLGVRKGKVVVACKDFTKTIDMGSTFTDTSRLVLFHDIKNSFMSSDVESYSGSGSETLLQEVLDTIAGQEDLKTTPGVAERFWDMFVVDAFIGNNDRNNGNWGLLWDMADGSTSLAPIYDNGNAFFNKRSLAQMEKRLADKLLMEEDACKTLTSAYKYVGLDNEGHHINPFTFIESRAEKDCTTAVSRFLDRVCMNKIECLINSVPENIGTLGVMPMVQKTFYLGLLKIRLEKLQELA